MKKSLNKTPIAQERNTREGFEATPRPWYYELQDDISSEDGNGDGYCWAVTASTKEEREGGKRSWPAAAYVQNPAYANSEANADYIVRAVNAHEELLAACKQIVRVLEHPKTTAAMPHTLKQVRSAIAKAEAQP